MITPAYAITATERVLPRMALDFTTGVLDPRVTVARLLNTATRTNSSGLIEVVNANLPRFDYDPVTLAPKGLLIEEARTNLLLRSQNATVGPWSFDTSTGSGVTLTGGVAPDGATQFAVFNEGTSTGAHRANQGVSVVAGTTYTFSAYIKAGTSRYILVGSNSGGMAIDTQTWTVTQTIAGANTTTTNAALVNVGGGVYRASVSVAHTTATTVFFVISTSTSATPGTMTPAFAGTSRTAIFTFCGFETGAFPTSYIPTTTTSLTRNADVVSMTGTNFSDWYNASEGAFSVSYIASNATKNQNALFASNGASTERMGVRCINSSSQTIIIGVAGGVTQWNAALNGQTINALTAACWAYKLNNVAWARSGANAGTDTLAVVPTVNQLRIGADETGVNLLNGYIQKINYWPQRITDAENTAFSK